jgi:hypothetical protein
MLLASFWANKTQMWHWVWWVGNNLSDKPTSSLLKYLSHIGNLQTFRRKAMLLLLGRSPYLLTQFLECLKMYWVPLTRRLSTDLLTTPTILEDQVISKTADRTSNFVVSALKIQATSSSETSVFTSWHLLPYWKTSSHLNTADRTTNFVVSALKIQATSSSEKPVFTRWHLLP